MKRTSHLIIGIFTGLLFLITFNLSAFSYNCNEIRNNVIRLHVIANSDSEKDQDIKLKVRDAVLLEGAAIFDGSVTIDNAIAEITPNIDKIISTAEKIININGETYSATAVLTTEFFDTRVYDNNITLPAGKYLALKIILGEGKGQNWWCIMFPALCLPAATENSDINMTFSDAQTKIIANDGRYRIKFKIVEILEKLKEGDI